jgi:hypothetical protein
MLEMFQREEFIRIFLMECAVNSIKKFLCRLWIDGRISVAILKVSLPVSTLWGDGIGLSLVLCWGNFEGPIRLSRGSTDGLAS